MSQPWHSDRPAPGAELSPERIIPGAEAVTTRLIRTLPDEDALLEIATAVVETARKAQISVRRLASPVGLRRIRLYVVVLVSSPALAQDPNVDQMHVEALEYPTAAACSTCHPTQYRQWSVSPHAYSQLSPVFYAMQQGR